MSSSTRSLLCVSALALGCAVGSCTPNPNTPDAAHDGNSVATDAQFRAVLAHEGEHLVVASYRALARDLALLETATARFAEAPTDENRTLAQEAFLVAMDSAERAEVFQIGPAAPVGSTPEAAGLRDEYLPWPIVNACRIDQEMVEGSHTSEERLAAEALNVRGLSTIEYLLFVRTTATYCGPSTSIVLDGSWAALGDDAVRAGRARYAHTATVLARRVVDDLLARWEGGGFLDRLRTAGTGSTTFASAHDGLNALSDAIFYVYEPLLDLKIGRPAGLYTCPTATCADGVEWPFLDALVAETGGEGGSLRAMRVNLETFEDAYLGRVDGVNGPGFDDLLQFFGATDLDRRMQEAITAAKAAVAAIEGPLSVAVVARNAQVIAAVDALDALTTLMKTELITLLDVELPMRAEGDND